MILRSLEVEGFGRLSRERFSFRPGLNVIVGPNEAGKSTVAAAIVASLFGLRRGEKDRWRPWQSGAFATTLTYETADGKRWEVQRSFELDARGVRVYDENGADVAARIGRGRSVSPGEVHLHISADVFLQSACARQRAVGLDAGAAGDVSTALAQALSGGPKEDAAIGALARLDEALRKHVGTDRAHKNVPLKKLREIEAQQSAAAATARAAMESLASLRERIASERAKQGRLSQSAAELERRIRALRAAHLQARFEALKEYRDEVASLQALRSQYDDVAEFPLERVALLDDAYHSWRIAESVADAAARDLAEEALNEEERTELAQRRADAGTLDDESFATLRAAAARSEAAETRLAAASREAAVARRHGQGGGTLGGALIVAALVGIAADVGVAIAHLWIWTAVITVIAFLFSFVAVGDARSRAGRQREAETKQRIADAALSEERLASHAVAAVLEPLGIATMDELVRRRERYVALSTRERSADKAAARAATSRQSADAEGARFDALAGVLAPRAGGDRTARRAAVHARLARRRERDGLDARLAMLAMQRSNILHGDDEFALQADFDALITAGVEPAGADDPQLLRGFETERAEVDAHLREAERLVATLEGELRVAEESIVDVAALDETLALTRREIAQIEAFARAVKLARDTIEARKDEAHRAFARRLEEYSAPVLSSISGGRYGEVRLDPATLAIRIRIPETNAIEDVDRLSAGTRDQIALVVRFATARMFAEGLETPPLLLDDPFAFWDGERISRCLPVLLHGALDAQCILFTASTALADAAEAAGATRIELGALTTSVA